MDSKVIPFRKKAERGLTSEERAKMDADWLEETIKKNEENKKRLAEERKRDNKKVSKEYGLDK